MWNVRSLHTPASDHPNNSSLQLQGFCPVSIVLASVLSSRHLGNRTSVEKKQTKKPVSLRLPLGKSVGHFLG